MKLPNMKFADRIAKRQQVKFGGFNHSIGASDGDLWDMKNLTSDHYPVLASRQPRLLCNTLAKGGGLFSWDKLCWVDGTDFYFDGEIKGQVSEGKKVFATLGPYIVIFPDKCYYNVDSGEFGSMTAKWEGASLTFTNGLVYGEAATANTIQCVGVNWTDYFREGDTVSISGCTTFSSNNKDATIHSIDGDKLYFSENAFILAGDDGTQTYTENGNLMISRDVPDMNYLCENENRLWGCSDTVIYASKFGDIFNWHANDLLDTDSWTTDTGSAGVFTGCVTYGGFPVFFKEDHIYKIYGSLPSDFEALGSATLGLAAGSGGSLAVAGETLFYLGRNGITAYSGGIPQPVASAFGTTRFKNAVGGSDGLKYYVSMQDDTGNWGLYVYDTQRGLWHKEDGTHVTHFTRYAGNLYFLDEQGQIWIAGTPQDPPEGSMKEETVEWMVEFADFTGEDPNKKGIGKLQIRLELEKGATAQVWMQFDSDGRWQRVSRPIGENVKRSYYLPIVPRRADHYRLKITGTGACRIYSLVREAYSGSELRSKTGRN